MIHIPITNFNPRFLYDIDRYGSQGTAFATWSSFPSGCEENIQILGSVNGYDVVLSARIQSSGELMRLFLATDAVRRMGATSVSAFVPYLPYARQDRVCHGGEALSAAVMANLINAQRYKSFMSFMPHSGVMPALINNFSEYRHVGHLVDAVTEYPEAKLCSPDAGALKRTGDLARMIGHDRGIVTALKDRSTTGVSTSVVLGDIENGDVIIVDDICDGGATFIALADVLKNKGAKRVVLCVAHGLFTKGVEHLRSNGIDAIYTTNSYMLPTTDKSLINISEL